MKALAIGLLLSCAVMARSGAIGLEDDDSLHARWQDLWNRLEQRGAAGDHEKLYRVLVARYSEPHRAYHNLDHVEHVLAELDQVRDLAEDPVAVELALWCHDVVYDIGKTNNEELSARFAEEAAVELGSSAEWADRVSGLVLATRHDTTSRDIDAQLVVDIDLAILGQPRDRFDAYEEAIRSEYAQVIEERGVAAFNAGRAAILKRFLSRPTIYATDFFRRKYEEQARANLQRSIERLE